jgi:general stress protein 26
VVADIELGLWLVADDIRPRVTHHVKGNEQASVLIATKGMYVRISGSLTADDAQRIADRFHEIAVHIDRVTGGTDQ